MIEDDGEMPAFYVFRGTRSPRIWLQVCGTDGRTASGRWHVCSVGTSRCPGRSAGPNVNFLFFLFGR